MNGNMLNNIICLLTAIVMLFQSAHAESGQNYVSSANKIKSCAVSVIKQEKGAGKSIESFKEGGCTALELYNAGFTLKELKEVFTLKELIAAGFKAKQLEAVGFNLEEIKKIVDAAITG